MMSPGGDEASSGSDTVPPFGFAKGDLDADGEACDAPCARCDEIEVGRDAEPGDCTAGGSGPVAYLSLSFTGRTKLSIGRYCPSTHQPASEPIISWLAFGPHVGAALRDPLQIRISVEHWST